MKKLKKIIAAHLIVMLLFNSPTILAAGEYKEDNILHIQKFEDSQYGIYGADETLVLKDELTNLMHISGEDPTYTTSSMWLDDEELRLNKPIKGITNTINALPKEYRDLNVFIYPGYLKEINGYYVKPQYKEGPGSILLATSPEDMLDTFYHELGHHIQHIHYKDNNIQDIYKDMLEEKIDNIDSRYSSDWLNSLDESYAEDFKVYIQYSLKGIDLNDLRLSKKTRYEFNNNMIHIFDDLFPEIKRERLQNIRFLDKFAIDLNKAEGVIPLINNGILNEDININQDITKDQFLRALYSLYKEYAKEELDSFSEYEDFFRNNGFAKSDYLQKKHLVDISKIFTSIHGRALIPNRSNINQNIDTKDLILYLKEAAAILIEESY